MAHGNLAATYYLEPYFGWTDSPQQSMAKAFEHAQKGLALDDNNAWTHALMGCYYLVMRQWEKAIVEGARAVALGPNMADTLALVSITLKCVGKVNEAQATIEKAIRLNPIAPEWYLHELATNYRLQGRYDEAIAILEKNLDRNPDYMMSRFNLTSIYSMAGKLDEARAMAKEVLRKIPDFSSGQFMKGFPYKDKKIVDDVINSLRGTVLPP